jgi:hypothetical protein
MVRRALCLFSFYTSTLFFSAALHANTTNLDYKIGEPVEADVVATVRLVVVDPDATAALKEREAQRVPVIYRFYPRTIDDVAAAFHSTFAATHSNFLDAVDATFHQRKLEPTELSSPAFQSFVSRFQKQNILFPVDVQLATLWAGGESDEQIESTMTSPLHETMRLYIRSDTSPADLWVGSTLRLVSLADNESTTARLVEERGNNINKTNFVSLQRAKTELQSRFTSEQQAAGKYVASFVKPNCLMEADLTRELRAKRTEGMVAADHYEAGQIIAHRGQVVDKKIAAALAQLKEKTAVGRLQTMAIGAEADAARNTERTRWLIGLSSGTVVMLLFLLWRMTRRETQSLLPARIPDSAMNWAGNASEESWRQRALRAEQHVEKAQAAARAGLISQIAQWLSDRMTRKLISQRTELLDAHQSAAIEIAEMEARLEKVHAPLQERLLAYERRIAELEKELTVKGEENRELIKAKIEIARKQLEIERGKSRLEFN